MSKPTEQDLEIARNTIIRIEDEIKVKSAELAAMLSEQQTLEQRLMLKAMEVGACSAQLDYVKRWLEQSEATPAGRLGVGSTEVELSIFGREGKPDRSK